jgi:hypothetical protein
MTTIGSLGGSLPITLPTVIAAGPKPPLAAAPAPAAAVTAAMTTKEASTTTAAASSSASATDATTTEGSTKTATPEDVDKALWEMFAMLVGENFKNALNENQAQMDKAAQAREKEGRELAQRATEMGGGGQSSS